MTFVSFQYAGRSDIGERKRQEDAYGVKVFEHAQASEGRDDARSMELIAVLADGMGGHAGGAIASELATTCFMSNYPKIRGPIDKRLLLSLDVCNKKMAAAIKLDQKLQGMGCTLLGVAIDRHRVHWVSVGDSLLYFYHKKKLVKLNEDHSLAPIFDGLVANGEMTQNEAVHHPRRNMLRSALTGDDIKLVDLNREVVPLSKGDWLILASDGLGTLEPSEMEAIITENNSVSADQLAQALVAGVMKKARQEQDNVTVLAIGFDEVKGAP